MINDMSGNRFVYVYYDSDTSNYNYSVREHDEALYNDVVDKKTIIYGALVKSKHMAVLKALLDKMSDYKEYFIAIKLFSSFI